ncbi:MAG: GNAT family N-acetyltransferase [Treponema sp.]
MQILSIEAEEFQHQFTVSEINKMQIISVNERTFSLAQSYLLPIEQKCVFLSQLVRKHSPDIYIILDKNPDNSNNSDKSSQLINLQNVLGVFYLNKSLFHCFKDTSKVNIADFTPLFYEILTQNQASIKNISGEKDGTDFFLEVIRNLSENPDSTFTKKFNVKQINDYKLMVLPHQQFQDSQKLYNDDFIMRCTENDMENLFEIERNYLQDEVAVRGQKVSDAEVSMRLRQILKNQLYFALISDDRIVSKAYTNAIGKNWIQIGGVYTLFQFRQNGYAALTVSTLCKRILQAHKNISLFVKTKNLPAQQLYQKIGFTFHSDYKIVYFE